MREPCRDCIVECDRLEKDESIRVNFSNLYGQLVIEFLEMNPLSYRRDNKRQISDSIPHKRLIDQFIPNNILVASESRSKFHPELSELFIELGTRFVKLPESLPHIIAEVVLPPVLLIAVFPAGQSSCIQLDTFLSGEGESLVQFKFVHQPSRNSIPAKLLSNQILVEVYQRVYPIRSRQIYQTFHFVQVGLVVTLARWLHSCPPKSTQNVHHAQTDPVEASFPAVYHVLFGE